MTTALPVDGLRLPTNAPAETTLERLLWHMAAPNHYHSCGAFFTRQAAETLHAIDARFFERRNGSGWLVWERLIQWGSASDISSRSFNTSDHERSDGANAWLAWLVPRLPEEAFEDPRLVQAWQAALAMGVRAGALALAARRPQLWHHRDEQGRPGFAVRDAPAWVWDEALAQGVDPWQPAPGGQPVWRQALPQKSQTLADGNTLREAVETWVSQNYKIAQANIGTSHAWPVERVAIMKDYLLGTRMAAMAHAKWKTLDWGQKLAHLQSLPHEWTTVNHSSRLGPWWMTFFEAVVTDKNGVKSAWLGAKRWSQTLKGNGAWRRQIGPLADLAVWLCDHADQGLPPASQWPPVVAQAMREPQADKLLETLSKAFARPERWAAVEKSVRLELSLTAPVHRAVGPRL